MASAVVAANATAASAAVPQVDTWSTLLTTLGYLCLILGVIFLAFWLLRRLGVPGVGVQGGADAPRLVGRLMLGQRQSVVVVRHRGRELLLGVTEHSITRLSEVEETVEAESESEPTGRRAVSFAALLRRSVGK